MQDRQCGNPVNTNQNMPTETRGIKIPYVVDGDDTEVYLSTFERSAFTSKWTEDTWAFRLAT